MNIFSGVYIGKGYVLFPDKKKVYQTVNSVVTFYDGSFANVDTGEFEDKKADSEPFILVKLEVGINNLSFGTQNNNPQLVSTEIMNLQVDYDGPIEILPSEDGKISIQENSYCYASVAGDIFTVSQTNFVQISCFSALGNSVSISNVKTSFTEELPALKIWAPSQASFSGDVDSLTFTDLKNVEVSCENIKGNSVEDTISIDIAGDVDLTLKTTSTLKIDATGDVTLKMGNVKSVDIDASGDVDIDCKNVESLTVDLTGDLDLTGQEIKNLVVEGSGDIDITTASSDIIDIETTEDVNLESDSLGKLSVEAAGDVKVSVKNGKQDVTIDTTGDVTLILSIAENVSVDTTGDVVVRAFEYIHEPDIDTTGNEKVTLRK